MCSNLCVDLCVCVRVHECVFACVTTKVNPGSTDPNSIFIVDTGETQHIISFDGRAWSLTEHTVSCEKGCLGASDGSIYE